MTNFCVLGCFGDGMLLGRTGNISTPTFIEKECRIKGDAGFLQNTYNCYYQIRVNQARNVSIEFKEFKLNDGSFGNCNTARQVMVITPGTTAAEEKYVHIFLD